MWERPSCLQQLRASRTRVSERIYFWWSKRLANFYLSRPRQEKPGPRLDEVTKAEEDPDRATNYGLRYLLVQAYLTRVVQTAFSSIYKTLKSQYVSSKIVLIV